jgi:hypothetical protein
MRFWPTPGTGQALAAVRRAQHHAGVEVAEQVGVDADFAAPAALVVGEVAALAEVRRHVRLVDIALAGVDADEGAHHLAGIAIRDSRPGAGGRCRPGLLRKPAAPDATEAASEPLSLRPTTSTLTENRSGAGVGGVDLAADGQVEVEEVRRAVAEDLAGHEVRRRRGAADPGEHREVCAVVGRPGAATLTVCTALAATLPVTTSWSTVLLSMFRSRLSAPVPASVPTTVSLSSVAPSSRSIAVDVGQGAGRAHVHRAVAPAP